VGWGGGEVAFYPNQPSVCPVELQDDQAAPLTSGEAPFRRNGGGGVPSRGIVSGHVAKGGRKRERGGGREEGAEESADGGIISAL
jgi:hypothetical protein